MGSTPRKSKNTLSLSLMETIASNSPPLMVQLLHAQSWNFAAIKRKLIPGCSNHASQNGHQHIAIRSSDTDVEVLACYYQAVIAADITLISGTKRISRIVSIRQAWEKLGREICEVLPSLHAITGCDSVSAFSTKGKKKGLDIVQLNPALRQIVSSFGERFPPNEEDLTKMEGFVCAL